MPKCKLCQLEKSLIKKSHIIPNFMYKGLYDEHHKIRTFSPSKAAAGERATTMSASGEYEGGLLCKECDNTIIGGYEDYARRALYGGNLPIPRQVGVVNGKNRHGVSLSACSNVDYRLFKLFLLSVLWRASISTRPFFSEINLGPHEEVLRNMIFTSNPGEVYNYPILFLTYKNNRSMPVDLITQPRTNKLKSGHRASIFMITGMVYLFYISAPGHTIPQHILAETISHDNSMNIYHIPHGKSWDVIMGQLGLSRR